MDQTNPKLDRYFSEAKKWQQEVKKLRAIILGCGLAEEMKWGSPCYTLQKKNIVIIQIFKEYCAILFFKGALLKDASGVLVRPGEHTQAGRQIRFSDVREMVRMEAVLKAYIQEAIEVEKSGVKVARKKTAEFTIPEEFRKKFEEIPTLKTAFDALTPGRQRAYIFHFSAPKQSTTRASRVEKCMQRILDGKGLNDS